MKLSNVLKFTFEFFNKGVPSSIPKFLETIPTDEPTTLRNFSNIITSIVSAMETAPSMHQASLAWHLFLWLPHLILIDNLETPHQSRESILIRDLNCLTSCTPMPLFKGLMIPLNPPPLPIIHPVVLKDNKILSLLEIKKSKKLSIKVLSPKQ